MPKDHSDDHQTNLPLELQILNISVNMGRIGKWATNDYVNKKELITMFMDQTDSFLDDLKEDMVSKDFQDTLIRFKEEFKKLKNEPINNQNKLLWTERALTWADILQIRAKLA